MHYDDFRSAFLAALRDSGLLTIGPLPNEEVLDLRTTDRTVAVYVKPVGREMGAPFHISGKFSWRWDALQEARTATTEEDMLTELLGREDARGRETMHPRLRVDVELRAGLEYGKSVAMPSREAWFEWRREALAASANGGASLGRGGYARGAGRRFRRPRLARRAADRDYLQ